MTTQIGLNLTMLPTPPSNRVWGVEVSPKYSESSFDLVLIDTETDRPTFWCCIGYVDDNGEHHYVSEVEEMTDEILIACANQTLRMLDLQF